MSSFFNFYPTNTILNNKPQPRPHKHTHKYITQQLLQADESHYVTEQSLQSLNEMVFQGDVGDLGVSVPISHIVEHNVLNTMMTTEEEKEH